MKILRNFVLLLTLSSIWPNFECTVNKDFLQGLDSGGFKSYNCTRGVCLGEYNTSGTYSTKASCEASCGSSTGGGCTSYDGPKSDPQSSASCMAAYAYKCQNNAQAVAANCETYRWYQTSFPGIPACPYCN